MDEMNAIVQEHARPASKETANANAERMREFIQTRKNEILTDLTPQPPDWPEQETPCLSTSTLQGAERGDHSLFLNQS